MVEYKHYFFKFVKNYFLRINFLFNTVFIQTPRTSNKPIKSSTNAKIQIFLWLGIEEQYMNIFKQLPAGFDMPPLPLSVDTKYLRYNGQNQINYSINK